MRISSTSVIALTQVINRLARDATHEKRIRILARGLHVTETDEFIEPCLRQRGDRFKSPQRFDAYGAHRSFLAHHGHRWFRAFLLRTRKLDCFAACAAEIDRRPPRFPAS